MATTRKAVETLGNPLSGRHLAKVGEPWLAGEISQGTLCEFGISVAIDRRITKAAALSEKDRAKSRRSRHLMAKRRPIAGTP
jgi:hypothetical protein